MPGGGYRYYRDAGARPRVRGGDGRAVRRLRRGAAARARAGSTATFPRADGEPEAARRRAVNAKALDLLRGLLPAASLSHMGIYATGQAYEQLILHLIGHPLPEARAYGEHDPRRGQGDDAELRRARRAARTAAASGSRYLERRRAAAERWAARLGLDRRERGAGRRPVRPAAARRRRRGAAARRAAVRGRRRPARRTTLEAVARARARTSARACWPTSSASARTAATGPGRGFEALRYRFEVVSDYGAFRDLQRHRMLTVQWQALTPDLGAGVPEEVVAAGAATSTRGALERSRAEYERLVGAGLAEAAPYALCLGYRIRYVLDLNAREAMHLIELRSGREGHPATARSRTRCTRQIADAPPGRRRRDDARRHARPSRGSSGSSPRCGSDAPRGARRADARADAARAAAGGSAPGRQRPAAPAGGPASPRPAASSRRSGAALAGVGRRPAAGAVARGAAARGGRRRRRRSRLSAARAGAASCPAARAARAPERGLELGDRAVERRAGARAGAGGAARRRATAPARAAPAPSSAHVHQRGRRRPPRLARPSSLGSAGRSRRSAPAGRRGRARRAAAPPAPAASSPPRRHRRRRHRERGDLGARGRRGRRRVERHPAERSNHASTHAWASVSRTIQARCRCEKPPGLKPVATRAGTPPMRSSSAIAPEKCWQ